MYSFAELASCDLLRINYLCGRITNPYLSAASHVSVVICSELTTFAVESPTGIYNTFSGIGCDLLRINYLCGRITNPQVTDIIRRIVVICSELTTFAVESPTVLQVVGVEHGCDLLRINYLCGRITNLLISLYSRK